MPDEKVDPTVIKIGAGAVAGIVSGVANAAAPHVRMVGGGTVNASSNFFNGMTKALKHHKGVVAALGAGATAVVGTGAATAAVAAAPFVLAAAAVGAVAYGGYKLIENANENDKKGNTSE